MLWVSLTKNQDMDTTKDLNPLLSQKIKKSLLRRHKMVRDLQVWTKPHWSLKKWLMLMRVSPIKKIPLWVPKMLLARKKRTILREISMFLMFIWRPSLGRQINIITISKRGLRLKKEQIEVIIAHINRWKNQDQKRD